MRNRMEVHDSEILNALSDVPTKIRVANFSKTKEVPEGMLVGVRTSLSRVLVYLNQARTSTNEETEEEEDFVAYSIAAVQYNENS